MLHFRHQLKFIYNSEASKELKSQFNEYKQDKLTKKRYENCVMNQSCFYLLSLKFMYFLYLQYLLKPNNFAFFPPMELI